jgi:hypothetical protein
MKSAAYRIVLYQDGWGVEHDGRIASRRSVRAERGQAGQPRKSTKQTGRSEAPSGRDERPTTGGHPCPRRRRCATCFTTR